MKLALIGKGPGRELAPLKGEGMTTWGVNDLIANRDVDVCFWMDRHLMKDSQMDLLTTQAVNHNKTPMYSVKQWADIPTSIAYPRDAVMEVFGGVDYFGDSFDYMLALALCEGFRDIHLYGFTYAYGGNYVHEKPAAEFWIGIALGLGVKISLHGKNCELLKTKDGKVYSYQNPQGMDRKNISIPRIRIPKDTVSLSVPERVELAAISVYFSAGSYATARFAKDLHKKVVFTHQEAKEINLRPHDGGIGSQYGKAPMLVWDDNRLPDKEVELTTAEKALVAAWLNKLSKEGRVTWRMLSLYEKFCLGLAQRESPVLTSPPAGDSQPTQENADEHN